MVASGCTPLHTGDHISDEKHPPIRLKTASGVTTAEFQLHDSLLFEAADLLPKTGYTVRIIREDGRILSESFLSTDRYGRIPETVLWYDIGIRSCSKNPPRTDMVFPVQDYEIRDLDHVGKRYTATIVKDDTLVRTTDFRVSEALTRPSLYAVDSRGCPKSGFLIGEEDVWVEGRNFPKGSVVKLWAVPDSTEWKDADLLNDVTKQYGSQQPPVFELQGDVTSFKKLLWPRKLTSLGSYDVVAEVLSYPFGAYHLNATAQTRTVVANLKQSGFIIQRRQGVKEPLEMNLAGTRQSPLIYRSTFLTSENVYVGVDPVVQPNYIGKTGDIYIVPDRNDATWTVSTALPDPDASGTVESISVQFVCGNCWATLAWTAPLTPGKYDVVLDFDRDKKYTSGVDLIDSLDPAGFTVAEIRVDSISFNYGGSNAITIYDNVNHATVGSPEFYSAANVVKPAAWVRGGAHTVQVTFKADPAVASAQIWAENGLGGLNSSGSPVSVNFTNGTGQGTFTVNNAPAAVGKYLFAWDWKYKNVNGAVTGTQDMGTTEKHLVYAVLGTPVPLPDMSQPWLEILDYAATWASGATTKEGVMSGIMSNGYSNHYTWNMDCMLLASDFVRLVSTQGIPASQHRWGSIWASAIDDMTYQQTKVIDPVGPTWGSTAIQWSWHQWAEAEGAQRDPSAAASVVGNWGVYEDFVFLNYEKAVQINPTQTQWVPNQPGQSVGCEAPMHRFYTSSPTLYDWRGPDR